MSGGLTGASSRALLRLLGQPGFEPWAIRFPFDDEIVGIAGEAIDGALRPHGIGKRGEPFVRPAVRGDDHRPDAIALEEEVVEIAALDGIEHVDGEVVENQEVDGDEFSQLGFDAVVEARA